MVDRLIYLSDGRRGHLSVRARVGFVERFFPQSDRMYGFARLDDGSRFFFHTRQARATSVFLVKNGPWKVRFHPDPYATWIPDPEKEEGIIAVVGSRSRGSYAELWARLDDYEDSVRLCALFNRIEIAHQS